MPHQELIAALETRIEADLTKLREELARQRQEAIDAQEIRVRAKIAAARNKVESETRSACCALRRQAERSVAARLAQARSELLERLFQIAIAQLPELRRQGGADLFEALVRELPAGVSWLRVRIHPQDARQARILFPEALLSEDEACPGGVAAEADSPGLRVDNTLGTRLHRAWPTLSLRLLAEIEANAAALDQSVG